MAKAKAVAKKEVAGSTVLLQSDEFEAPQDFNTDDLMIPFMVVLQKLSPQVDDSSSSYIKGAKAGMIFNSATDELFDKIVVVPSIYVKRYIEWIPRDEGGGFVADHGADATMLNGCTKDDRGRDVLENGNHIVPTGTYYVLLVNPNGAMERVVIGMAVTQLKVSRKWNTLMSTIKIQDPREGAPKGSMVSPPLYWNAFELTSVPDENKKGQRWESWGVVKLDTPVLEMPNGDTLYVAAREFRQAVVQGVVKVAMPTDSTGTADKDIPF